MADLPASWKVMPVCQSGWSYSSDVVFRWLLTSSGSGSQALVLKATAVSQSIGLPAAGPRKEGIGAGKDRRERAIWDTTDTAMIGEGVCTSIVPAVSTQLLPE